MELLAPAGTMPAFEAALAEGADAVYLGVPSFNARALSRDFSLLEIAGMIKFARERSKKVFLAMNSLIKDGELNQALRTLALLEEVKPDAFIVQDLGLLYLLRRYFPQTAVHASTLMAAHNSLSVNHLAALGCKRVVLARELNLIELAKLSEEAKDAGTELEIFVHGAMCFSYSGLCRFSSLHGGKSSLRGLCVQPCRRKFQWVSSGQNRQKGKGQEGYFFSMNDLCGIEQLAALQKAHVASLKIEGRLKSVAYVRNTVRAYRLALDALEEKSEEQRGRMLVEANSYLDAAMGRSRGAGYFVRSASAGLISPERSGNTGEMVGLLVKTATGQQQGKAGLNIVVQLRGPVKVGERLRLHDEQSDARISFTLRMLKVGGQVRKEALAGEQAELQVSGEGLSNRQGSIRGKLYRVDEQNRLEKVSEALRQVVASQQPRPLAAKWKRILADLAQAGEQTKGGKAGRAARGNTRSRGDDILASPQSPAQTQWWLKIASPEALRLRFPFPVSRIVLDLNPETLQAFQGGRHGNMPGRQPIWALPPIILEHQLAWYKKTVTSLCQDGATRFQVGHPSQIRLFDQVPVLELFGDASCNLVNSAALLQMEEEGYRGAQFSIEIDRATLFSSLSSFAGGGRSGRSKKMLTGLQVYGRPALFNARLKAPHFERQYSLSSLRGERYFLKQGEEGVSVHAHEPFSLLAHSHELSRSGLNYLVVDVSYGNARREWSIVKSLFHGKGDIPPFLSGNYAGNLV